MWNKMTILF